MNIYEQEKALESLLLSEAKATASLTIPLKLVDAREDLFIENLEGLKTSKAKINDAVSKSLAKIAAYEHPDLMYASAILVSTVMNGNDDVFLPEETWSARNTAVNIPYNDDHVEVDIIGHTIAARPLDSEGQLIEADDAPKYFDLEVDLVMYRGIFPAIAKEIVEKAPEGKKFVSMEAKFNNFDFGLVDTKGNIRVIARNKETAWLTKYLRAYGGDGRYQDYKVARVLRDFRFTGVGNVDNPANPGSEYTRFDDYELAAQSNLREQSQVVLYMTKGKIMEKIETLEQAQQVIADLSAKLAKAEGKDVETLANKLNETETKYNTAAQELEAEKGKLTVATQELDTLKAQDKELTEKVGTLTTERDAKATELDNIQKASKASERVAQLKELGVEVDDNKRKEVTEWSDATFATVIQYTKLVKGDNKENGGAASAADEAKKALDKAEAEKNAADVTGTSGDDTSDAEKTQKVAAKLVETIRGLNKKSPKSKKTE